MDGYASGGFSDAGAVTGNIITISENGTIKNDAVGGLLSEGTKGTSGNQAIMTGGSVGGNLIGGYIMISSPSNADNTVTLSGGSVSGDVMGRTRRRMAMLREILPPSAEAPSPAISMVRRLPQAPFPIIPSP